jgi:hypothetical protein
MRRDIYKGGRPPVFVPSKPQTTFTKGVFIWINVWPYAFLTHNASVYGQTDFLFSLRESNTK